MATFSSERTTTSSESHVSTTKSAQSQRTLQTTSSFSQTIAPTTLQYHSRSVFLMQVKRGGAYFLCHGSLNPNPKGPDLIQTRSKADPGFDGADKTAVHSLTVTDSGFSDSCGTEEHLMLQETTKRQGNEGGSGVDYFNTQNRISGPCRFACLNGGQCVNSESCDCSLYQATGYRCQTVPNQGFEREMTCRSWGQYNFETFDGLYFHFPGRCTYTLLRDCEEGSGVTVQVHNDPDCGTSAYSCHRSVSLFMNWDGEIRLNARNVTFKGQRLDLPYHIHDLMLEQISDYILATQHGFTLAWDGLRGSIYIKLSPDYVSRTCGLCGNFNADVQDDLRTSYGVPTEEIEMFGNSWQEVEPNESRCPIVSPGFTSPCSGVPDHVLQKIHEVCSLLLEPPFSDCHEFVSPLSYMASCTNDLCLSGPVDEMLCLVLSEYARACAHADHPLQQWRQDFPLCEKPCASDLQWRECISCCPQTCRQEKNCIDSRLACVDGCYCPEGLVLESGSCVLPSECPCEHHGLMYPSGQTLEDRCNTCTCVGGVWNCTDYTCPVECSITGDMFFQSFDGRVFSFASTCQYVLSKSHSSGRFTVTIQNAPCGPNLDGACLQSVSLVVDEDPRSELTLSHVGEVFLGGQYRISLPYSDELLEVQELSSMFVQVQTVFGLRLQFSWSESRLYLQLDQRWLHDTVGLCGTFNGNSQDDFLSPSGMIESTPQLFGNSWKVSSACAVSLSTPEIDPCDAHQQAVSYASEKCSVLTQDLFASCHEHLSPGPFLLQCRSDACKCGAPCFCSSLAHYTRHCRKHGVLIDFRAHIPECEVTCPYSMVYGPCVSSCLRRCSALSLPQSCSDECEEGCVCPEGTFYNHRTRTCVQRSECPCSFLGADYEPGDMIMTSAGVQLCTDGKLVSQTPASDGLCPMGQIYLNCSVAGVMPQRGVACERTCESYLLNLTCSSHEPCVSGCMCPPGLLKHGDECFEPPACPCLWKGKEYFPGDRVSSPCHHCVCQHGTFQCVFRPCASMCSVYGDRHYRTFDGLLYDYVGSCRVHLLKSSVDTPVSVMAENVDCFDSGVICRKSLLISVGQTVIAFDDASGKPNLSSVIDRKQRVFLFSAGIFSVVHFHEEDLTMLWDRKTTVHIQAGPRWQGKLSGLCGNFDLKTVNEMRTPESIESPTPQEFGNSWTATECLSSPDVRPPCSVFPLREPFAKRQCSVLLSEVFQSCHPVVDVTWFYMNCVADTCSCSRGGDCECFCSSVAAYAQRCCLQGVSVDWRSPSLCPYDCEYYNKVLGKGPYRLIPFRDRTSVLASSRSLGSVFLVRANSSESQGFLSKFMMTPGLSRSRPHDNSRVSFEAADRPNYFLFASPSGEVKLSKWRDNDAFWEGATFVLHRDTWIPGFVSLEAQSKPGFFLHATRLIHLLKYRHTDSYRKATLFRVTGPSADASVGPQCQWRYDSCSVPCFKTCSDPRADSCTSIPQVESCLPVCPSHMVLDEVTHRCVHLQDCINPPVGSDIPSSNTTFSAVMTPEVQQGQYTSRVTESPLTRTTTSAPYAITALFWFTDVVSVTDLTTTPEPTKSAEITTKTTIITTKPKTTTKKAEPTPSSKPSTKFTEEWIVRGSTTPVSITTVTSKVTTKEGGEEEEGGGATTVTTPKATPSTVLDTTKSTETTVTVSLQTARACTPPYAEIIDECTKLICVNHQLVLFNKSQSCPFTSDPPNCGLLGFAVLVNGDKCCPQWSCPCRCSLFPDLSVITYDGNSVAVFKAASYIITQLQNEEISVSVQECPADSSSPLLWNFTHLCLVALNITHKSNHVVIDRLQRRLYVNSRYAKPRFKKFGFEIYDTGNMYLIKTPAGLKLQWFHSTGMMVVDTEAHYNRLTTRGLCGFCDGDPSNDLTLPSGSSVSDSEAFIESWTIFNTTSFISSTRRRDANCTTSDCSECLRMLQGHDYRPCHQYVPPSTFCELWVRDTEYVNNHCVALSAYVASCHKFNICIEWRRPDHCPFLCPDGLQYQSCLPACSASSCPNQDFDSDPDQCSGLTEGCVCPEGTLLHRPYSKLCIQPDKCACTDSTGLPRSHGEVWKASHDACCMYRCDNDTIVPVEFNCSTAVPQCHRQGEVVISLADQNSCCPHKLCVCNQSLCELPPPQCNYGEKLVSYYRQDSCCPQYSCECDPELCESVIPSCRDDQTLISTRADGSCCLAHICMCASCSEAPPLCQDGEVLTVDFNTTDRCCPLYGCVCEPHRCPEISCPVGMSLVSSSVPGRCCPKQTCECACDKIASPKCGLGEMLQLDRSFMSDPQNQCSCNRYKCVLEPGCIFPERGLLLLPGQTLVEHSDGGVCYSRQCSRSIDSSSGLNIMRTTTHNCSTSCLPNQIYVPPKDQSSCCGFCKNISCSYEHENGTTNYYKPGRSWISNCIKYDCADTESGSTLISLPISCPPFNDFECLQNGGHVVSYMDGCCKTCNVFALLPFPVSPVSPTVSSNCERGKEDGKSCQKVTVRMTIRKNNCRSNRPVNVVSCDGKCPSASIYNYNINTYARFCKCCRETGLQKRTVQLYCSNNATWVNYDIQEPTDCSCLWS
ncbi:otogelin [Periophthalmus magnuspinnatus]|uniref:otogelin n=1 Tax=Periophthalmus magnuspinnatus TaxID=409849 RepID=UPI0024366888|nr:otogelin [Periophthalmus magnuspinnatus]